MFSLRSAGLISDRDWQEEIERIGADPGTWSRLKLKCRVLTFSAGPFSPPAASIIKQCMLSGGGDAIVSRGTLSCECDQTDVLLLGTEKQILAACASLKAQPFGLVDLARELETALEPPPLPDSLELGGKRIGYGYSPLVMGVLNVTPDSFSDGGAFNSVGAAVNHVLQMVADGAAIIDCGGESTRPGSRSVTAEEQVQRVIPVIKALRSESDVPVSIDTTIASVAEAALDAGADMINDTSALLDPDMPALAASSGSPVVIMHMQGSPQTMQDAPSYGDVFDEVYGFLLERVLYAETAGVQRSKILIDPGIGFGKRLKDNIVLLRRLDGFRRMGCRVLLGHSRKSFLGTITGEEVPAGRDLYTHVVSALTGGSADILRVHDVSGAVRSRKVVEALRIGR